MLSDLFQYKIAFKVPVIMLIFSIVGVWFNFIHIDLWLNDKLEAGYQFEISFQELLNIIKYYFNQLINYIKGEF